jgi:hypothetical protein
MTRQTFNAISARKGPGSNKVNVASGHKIFNLIALKLRRMSVARMSKRFTYFKAVSHIESTYFVLQLITIWLCHGSSG